ncbi:MAG: DNA topoisomerase I [Candidatus Kerfeldbacteria bacterium RIFCSPHIGHO2_12_FULL_48_17]|uniref:DNA topoisomerase 1 n=1 Tax=Candidatus Kerfeldbacteria bacterium RIFCSPHIGHO2_12_FULL_48_17 TaxID=1798542 RepID=A0A1G2B1W3_9BACT|nr:MAG: DNA topoisomerase I [Candidatus Kerfeldbacteria bacterium RIFCSPHIGHO2_12_FULL_48_17]
MSKKTKLVIVESPTKAKTISKFLGPDYKVESSFGHIRDLPKSKMGIDIEHDFEPKYVIPAKAKQRVTDLKKLAAGAEEIYFATDEDREGESIAWHLANIFKMDPTKTKRIVFHEITKGAIMHALEKPRTINIDLVNAQQARRVLDRLVGYELSPFLWKKIRRGLSAGRVQSVALRLIVEREREIGKFKPEEYWSVEGMFAATGQTETFAATLAKKDGKKIDKLDIKNDAEASAILEQLKNAQYHVAEIDQKASQKNPPPPFTTSTLQQEANKKLGYSAKQTMRLAQQLYEGINVGQDGEKGLITYMRTDAVNLSDTFINDANKLIAEKFGKEYGIAEPRRFKAKSKLAQEAHEAIRPTHTALMPDDVAQYLDAQQLKLYTLIWNRAVATQMAPAKIQTTGIDIEDAKAKYTFRATGSVIEFPGYLKIYPDAMKENILPKLEPKTELEAKEIKKEQHFTEAPARYTEASLVKILEENGIGRPSTYAPTISTIIDRGYVDKEQKKFSPTEIGLLVNDLLVEHFPKVVDYSFTSKMEDDLDEIASGTKKWQPIVQAFYLPFHENLEKKEKEINKKDLVEEATDEKCDKCGKPMVIKMGRFGKFLACTGYPECKNTKPLGADGKPAAAETTDEKCDKCGAPMVIKFGRFGKFLGCSKYPDCKGIKKIENKTGVTCTQCGEGEIVEKRGKRGTFYACNRYPTCKFALWSKPTGEKCPTCQSLLIYGKNNTAVCSSKECKFTKELPQKEE